MKVDAHGCTLPLGVREPTREEQEAFRDLPYAGNHTEVGHPDPYGNHLGRFRDDDGCDWWFLYDEGWDNVDAAWVRPDYVAKATALQEGEELDVAGVRVWKKGGRWWTQAGAGGVQFSKSAKAAVAKALQLV